MSGEVCSTCNVPHTPGSTCVRRRSRQDRTLTRPSEKIEPAAVAETLEQKPGSGRRGEVLGGRYELLDCLGWGGMGEIYLALDRRLQRRVAIKCLAAYIAGHPDVVARFRKEVLQTAQFEHPNIVRVLDAGLDDKRHPYLVLELLEGQTLQQLLKKEGRLSVDRAARILRQALRGLAKAHERLAHRDLKPANIMVAPLDGEEVAKIFDFGIAKILNDSQVGLTGQGRTVGTPGYMAPEALLVQEIRDPRLLDIYAMGMIFHEMLTGAPVWAGHSAKEIAQRVALGAQPPSLHSVVPHVPREISDVIARAMAREPADRFQSVGEFQQALRAALGESGPQVPLRGDALVPGTVVAGTYRIHSRIAAGGYGVLYRAHHRHLDRPVALKFVMGDGATAAGQEARARFAQEGRLASRIDHPNVVRVQDAGVWQDRPYLVFELVEGGTLREVWGTLTWSDFLSHVEQAAAGLQAIHRHGVIHRDVSPDNILIDGATRRAKVTDFGIARSSTSSLTQSDLDAVLGRLGYLAPEQAQDPRRVTPATDQWALAAIVYEALTGRPPYYDFNLQSSEAMCVMGERLQMPEPPPGARAANATVPRRVDAVLLRALSPAPGNRYGSVVEFVTALRAASAGGIRLAVQVEPQATSWAASAVSRSRRVLMRLGGSLVAAGVALLLMAVVLREREQAAADPVPAVSPIGAEADAGREAVPMMAKLTVESKDADAILEVDDQRFLLPITLERPLGTRSAATLHRGNGQTTPLDLAFSVLDGRLTVLKEDSTAPSLAPHRSGERQATGRRSRSAASGEPATYRRKRLTLDPPPAVTEDDLRGPKPDAGVDDEDRIHRPDRRRAPRRAPATTRDGAIIVPPEFQ